ncbi:hypothetical protein [Pseudoduganella armeniaca]|uniref:Uncharacterized protein n=1 Tax=Pseudoduganella armeniaca TaxID=2072590 RepID=A0A2R4CCQ5_9BURK|nr:hypothetical protein [Pseudoduganella armeniaca]AVR97389.1 hypothetical protein C9I28_18385 [Pseudoduganella armeniaca]
MEAIDTRTAQPHARKDRLHSDIVDKGILLQGQVGTVCALEYLRGHGVGVDVIQRVLAGPERRRKMQ